jgi:hypothetical protein
MQLQGRIRGHTITTAVSSRDEAQTNQPTCFIVRVRSYWRELDLPIEYDSATTIAEAGMGNTARYEKL